ncbi:MAG TPA: hypothetical protein VFW46_19130, partial [Stellaceae bacterium]|nr:hypothetical protein [Stellaceae bacterium]
DDLACASSAAFAESTVETSTLKLPHFDCAVQRSFAPLTPPPTSKCMASAPPDTRSLLLLFSEGEDKQNQSIAPDIISTRDTRGRFAKGRSGNPEDGPRGTLRGGYPMRDLHAHPVSGAALVDLTRREPYLLRSVASQFLPQLALCKPRSPGMRRGPAALSRQEG